MVGAPEGDEAAENRGNGYENWTTTKQEVKASSNVVKNFRW